jgi:cyclic lactone autoinducer peptide
MNKGGEKMAKTLCVRNICRSVSDCAVLLINKTADRKANALCHGYLHEPKVPKKLKKTL